MRDALCCPPGQMTGGEFAQVFILDADVVGFEAGHHAVNHHVRGLALLEETGTFLHRRCPAVK